jgi:uncharacterized membrane protein YbhN (UPF0104 family)
MKPGSRGALAWRWTPPAVIAALSVLAARVVPWGEVAARIAGASAPMLAIATVATYLAVAARLVAWWTLLQGVGVISLAMACRATIVGMAINCLLIANVGEAHRVGIVVREARVSASAVIASVVIERLIVSVPFAVLLAVSGWMLPLPPELARWRLIVLGAIAAMIIGLLLLARPGRQKDPGMRMASGWRLRAADALRRFRAAVRDLLSTGRTSLVLGLAVAHWVLQLIALVSVAAALQFPLPLAGSLLALLGMSASGSARLAPGNVGINQMVYVSTAATFGLAPAGALGVAIVLQVIQTVPLLGFALIMSVLPDGSARRGRPRPASQLASLISRKSPAARWSHSESVTDQAPARPPDVWLPSSNRSQPL